MSRLQKQLRFASGLARDSNCDWPRVALCLITVAIRLRNLKIDYQKQSEVASHCCYCNWTLNLSRTHSNFRIVYLFLYSIAPHFPPHTLSLYYWNSLPQATTTTQQAKMFIWDWFTGVLGYLGKFAQNGIWHCYMTANFLTVCQQSSVSNNNDNNSNGCDGRQQKQKRKKTKSLNFFRRWLIINDVLAETQFDPRSKTTLSVSPLHFTIT